MANTSTKQFRFVGSHAEDLASGAPMAPGDFVDLTADDQKHPHNAGLIADGRLIEVTAPSKREE